LPERGQRDPAATGERERGEDPTGQLKSVTEAMLTRAGEDGVGATEMPSVAARSGAGGWARRWGRRGVSARACHAAEGEGEKEGGRREGTSAAAGAF
jgi:hypothetical protein